MAPSDRNGETQPLLSTQKKRSSNHLPNSHSPTDPQRSPFEDTGKEDPSILQSFRWLFLGSYVNILLLAVPFSFVSHFAGWGSTADFVISFVAIVPLAGVLGQATEQVALKLGQTMGGLLNATFGNAVEAIVGILALTNNELRIVQSSMLGSILSNLLLVLGCSFLAAGYKYKESNFQQTAAQASSSILTLSAAALLIPAAYHASQAGSPPDQGGQVDGIKGILFISRGTAIILLVIYIAYLIFQLKSHPYLFQAEQEDEDEEAEMSVTAAIGALLLITVVTAFCADYLVGSIDEFANTRGIPKQFIGLILLPIVGNAAEHVTAVWMAAKGKMEITIGVSVGSSIQIAVGVIPILVLVAWPLGRELTLQFDINETISLFVAIILSNLLLQDGKSNWLEGFLLVALYIVIALVTWVS